LGLAGYEVISAEDGEQALRYAREMRPDLVLLDLLLPKLTGTEVLARLKNEPATARIPVVVVSGLSERNRQKLIDAGADDYLEKSAVMPDPKMLADVVCRINRRRGPSFPQMSPPTSAKLEQHIVQRAVRRSNPQNLRVRMRIHNEADTFTKHSRQ
jgi:DNA-binding response OmpR family regulator